MCPTGPFAVPSPASMSFLRTSARSNLSVKTLTAPRCAQRSSARTTDNTDPSALAKRSVKSNSGSSKKYCFWPAQRRHCSITPNRPESRSPLCHGNRKSAQPSPAPRGTPRTCDRDACPRPSPGATPLPSSVAHCQRGAPTAQTARCRLRIRCGQVQTLVPRALKPEAEKHDFRIPTCFPTYGTTGPPVRERKTPTLITRVFEKESPCPSLRLCSRHQPDPILRIERLKKEKA